jgi:cobalt-zinc-cadmium efflux system membrane fusion protein
MTGRLVWNDDVTVRVFSPVSGHIHSIIAAPGQPVSPGESLAKVASPEFGQAQAEARKAVADLKLAERSLNRVRELYDHGAAAQKDLEAAEAEQDRANSEKDRALATLKVYGGGMTSRDNFYSLSAPIGGVIVEKSINPGQEVRADQVGADSKPLFIISDPARLWVVIDATAVEVSALHPGSLISLKSSTFPGETFPARVEVVSDFIDPNSRTIKVRGSVDNSQHRLKAEMFVTAELSTPLTAGVTVPASAVFLKGDRHFVFVNVADGTFQLREVALSGESAGATLIGRGIEAGENVVTEGALLLSQILIESGAQPESTPIAMAHD